jgi:CubicO group peptidase (beta-lactamase class C family)
MLMRRSLIALTTAAVLAAHVPASANDALLVLFRTYLESLREQAGIPGLAAIIVGRDDVLWEHASGRQDIERNIAARPDTPFHFDGLTQVLTASLVLRCVEDGRVSLDDRIGDLVDKVPEPDATIRQLLTHTSGPEGRPIFAYRPKRLDPLAAVVRACTNDSFRETLANLFDRLAMADSVPGPDVVGLAPPDEGLPSRAERERYAAILQRLATPYEVDGQGRAARSDSPAKTLAPATGLITTVRDFARFDLALRDGDILRDDALEAAWRPAAGAGGADLPHGLGWFVQEYNGETVVWQFGVGEDASSSLVITIPARGFTLVLAANSDRLVEPFPLAAGDLTVSPFARLFLGLFVR